MFVLSAAELSGDELPAQRMKPCSAPEPLGECHRTKQCHCLCTSCMHPRESYSTPKPAAWFLLQEGWIWCAFEACLTREHPGKATPCTRWCTFTSSGGSHFQDGLTRMGTSPACSRRNLD